MMFNWFYCMNGIKLGQILYDVALFHTTTAVNRRRLCAPEDIVMEKKIWNINPLFL